MGDLYGVDASRAATDVEPRCGVCGKLLARLATRPWAIDCPRCKARNRGGEPPEGGNRPRRASSSLSGPSSG